VESRRRHVQQEECRPPELANRNGNAIEGRLSPGDFKKVFRSLKKGAVAGLNEDSNRLNHSESCRSVASMWAA
jgi:hypothetical protein